MTFPDGMSMLDDPFGLIGRSITPVYAMEGPLAGPMVELTLRFAHVSDIVRSFATVLGQGDEPVAIQNIETVTMLIARDSISGLATELLTAGLVLDGLSGSTENPSE